MSAITITIIVDVPDGAAVIVGQAPAPAAAAQLTSLEGDHDWKCPYHGVSRLVPAGTSKKTGKPYPAFRVCSEAGCEQKEPASR